MPLTGLVPLSIVFVHGLIGSRTKTWTNKKPRVFWPRDLLPKDDYLSRTRILSFGYDADVVHFWTPAGQNRVGEHAANLVKDLVVLREETDTEERPVLFVTHSLGGLVFEDAMLTSRNSSSGYYQQLLECTRGVCFLGTPHCGSDWAKWTAVLGKSLTLVDRNNEGLLRFLVPGSEVLARVQHDFHAMLADRRNRGKPALEMSCYFEELPVKGVGKIVEEHSAILMGQDPQSIHANHMDMCKFGSTGDRGYRAIKNDLRRWVKQIVRDVQAQRAVESDEDVEAAESHPSPKLLPYASSSGTPTWQTMYTQSASSYYDREL